MRQALITAAVSSVLAVSGSSAMAVQILTDPGFEANPLAPSFPTVLSNFPLYAGQWGPESSARVNSGGFPTVTPASGNWMIDFDPNGTVSQTGQVIDLAPYAGLISAGFAGVVGGGYLNSDAPAAQAGTYLNFYTSTYTLIPTPAPLSVITLDNNVSTWELSTWSSAVPTNAAYAVFQFGFTSSTIGGINTVGTTTKGFADDAFVDLRQVPEPGSIGLLATAGAGVLLKRRRK